MRSATTPIYAGVTPAYTPGGGMPISGGQSGYSPTTPAYPRIGGAGTPAYPSSSPGYYGANRAAPTVGAAGASPAYAPYSAAPYGSQFGGGRTPGYQPGTAGKSPGYKPMVSSSPVYTPGNVAYSPTQAHYGQQPEPYYTPGAPGGVPPTAKQPEKDKKE